MATFKDFVNNLTKTKTPNLGTGFLGASKPTTNNFGGLVTPKQPTPVVNQSMSPNGATTPKPTVITPPKTPSITSNPKETFINNLTNTGAPKINDVSSATPTPAAKQRTAFDDYTDFLKSEKVTSLQKTQDQFNKRAADELLRTREREDELRKNAIGQLEGGQKYQLGEENRLSNKSLADLAIASSPNTEALNRVLGQAEKELDYKTGLEKTKAEQNKPFELSEGQARYEFDSASGQYKKVASVGKTYAPSTKTGGVDAQGNVVLTSPQKTKVNAVDAVLTSLDAYKTLYDSLANEQGGKIFGKDAGTLSGAYNALIFQIAQAAGTGALQAADREIVERMIPNPTSLSGAWGGLVKGGKAGGKNSIDQAAQVLNNTKATIIKAPQDPYGFNKQSMILISPDGQEFDASGLTPQELQEAIADGYTSQ